MKQAFPIDHAVPISKAIRAGDFVFTSAFGPWLFDPRNITYDEAGNIIDDGTGRQSQTVHFHQPAKNTGTRQISKGIFKNPLYRTGSYQ